MGRKNFSNSVPPLFKILDLPLNGAPSIIQLLCQGQFYTSAHEYPSISQQIQDPAMFYPETTVVGLSRSHCMCITLTSYLFTCESVRAALVRILPVLVAWLYNQEPVSGVVSWLTCVKQVPHNQFICRPPPGYTGEIHVSLQVGFPLAGIQRPLICKHDICTMKPYNVS